MTRARLGWLALLAALAPAAAHAEPADEARRTALFREGTAFAEEGEWARAAERFKQVIAIRSAPRALVALGIAEQNLMHLAAAKRAFTQARDDARAAHRDDDAATAEDALARVAPRVPRLRVRFPAGVAIARATLDDEAIARADATVEADPGLHELVVVAADGRRFRTTVRLDERGEAEAAIAFAAAPEPATSAAPLPERGTGAPSRGTTVAPSRATPIAPLVVGGVGIVAAGAGVAFWIAGKSQERTAMDLCGGGTTRCPLAAQPDAEGSHTKIVVGNVLFTAGLVVAAGAGVWFWRASASGPAAAPTPGGAWLGWRGTM